MSRTTVKQLDPIIWADEIDKYLKAREIKREADAKSRAQDSIIKSFVAKLQAAINGAAVARCGDATLALNIGAPVPGTLKLTNKTTVPLAEITVYSKGNEPIYADEVESIYGGRAGSITVTITGEV